MALVLLVGGAQASAPSPSVSVVEPDAGPPVEFPVLDLNASVLDLSLVTGPVDGAVTDAVAPDEQVFTASADVFFEFDSADLSARAVDELARISGEITAVQLATVQVVGHTDAGGTPEYNLDLSQRRADAVRAALAPQLDDATVTADGVGERQPVAPETVDGEDDPEGRAANRRVEIAATR